MTTIREKEKIQTIHMYQGSRGKYYTLGDNETEKYHWKFPLCWALDHWLYDDGIRSSGPKHCAECREKGCIENVFVGYCIKCYDYVYIGERGDRVNVSTIVNGDIRELWRAFDYMRGDNWYNIGDPVTVVNHPIVTDRFDYISDVSDDDESTFALPKPKLKRNNKYEEPSNTLSLIHPSLLEENYPRAQIVERFKTPEELHLAYLKKIAEGIGPINYRPEPIQWPFTPLPKQQQQQQQDKCCQNM